MDIKKDTFRFFFVLLKKQNETKRNPLKKGLINIENLKLNS